MGQNNCDEEDCLEVNVEKAKYMLISHHQMQEEIL
jgi:hypothetical protein